MTKLLTTEDVLSWALDVCHAERDTFYGEDNATAARLAQGQRLLAALEETEAALESQECYCICEEPCERCNDLNAYSRLRDALKEP